MMYWYVMDEESVAKVGWRDLSDLEEAKSVYQRLKDERELSGEEYRLRMQVWPEVFNRLNRRREVIEGPFKIVQEICDELEIPQVDCLLAEVLEREKRLRWARRSGTEKDVKQCLKRMFVSVNQAKIMGGWIEPEHCLNERKRELMAGVEKIERSSRDHLNWVEGGQDPVNQLTKRKKGLRENRKILARPGRNYEKLVMKEGSIDYELALIAEIGHLDQSELYAGEQLDLDIARNTVEWFTQ